MHKHRRVVIAVGTFFALACNAPCSIAANCFASYKINLTVQLGPELTNRKDNLLIELRKGSIGNSTVVDTKKFTGLKGIVHFINLCAGSYFIDIGNGDEVAVGPQHSLANNQQLNTTVQVTISQGNISTMRRSRL